jgi:hypothetical protein
MENIFKVSKLKVISGMKGGNHRLWSNICNCFVSIPNPKNQKTTIMATNEAGTALVTGKKDYNCNS